MTWLSLVSERRLANRFGPARWVMHVAPAAGEEANLIMKHPGGTCPTICGGTGRPDRAVPSGAGRAGDAPGVINPLPPHLERAARTRGCYSCCTTRPSWIHALSAGRSVGQIGNGGAGTCAQHAGRHPDRAVIGWQPDLPAARRA